MGDEMLNKAMREMEEHEESLKIELARSKQRHQEELSNIKNASEKANKELRSSLSLISEREKDVTNKLERTEASLIAVKRQFEDQLSQARSREDNLIARCDLLGETLRKSEEGLSKARKLESELRILNKELSEKNQETKLAAE